MVDLTLDGGFSQDLCGLLEGRGGHPAVGRKRGLRDTHEQLRGNGFLQRLTGLGVDLARGIARADLLVGILILKQIDHGAREQVRVTGLLDAHLAHHLADDDLDMLIVDVNALLTVNLQNFLNEVVMNGGRAADTQDIVRGQRAVLQLRALGDDVAVVHAQAGVRHRVDAVVAVVRGDDDVEQAALGRLFEADLTADLGEGRHLLGTARLKQFLDSRKTLGDIAARNAAGVEGSHRQLRTGLADGLGRDDTDRLAGADGLARGKVHAVALRANAAVGLARKHRADLDGVDIELLHEVGILGGHHVILGNEDLVRAGLHHVVDRIAAVDALGELFDDLAVLADLADRDAAGRAAVVGADDDILADVDHSAGQVTGVCRTKSRIGKALTGASGGGEVFKDGQTFAEVCLDRDLDRLTGGVGHQAAHTGQLTDLLHRTTGAGVRHHEDGVVAVHVLLQSVGDVRGGLFPLLDDGAVALVLGHEAHLELVFNVDDALLGLGNEGVLCRRNGHIRNGDTDGRTGGELVARGLDVIEHFGRDGEVVQLDRAVDDLAEQLLAADLGDLVVEVVFGRLAVFIHALDKAKVLRDIAVKDDAADGNAHDLAAHGAVRHLLDRADKDGLVDTDEVVVVGEHGLVLVAVNVQIHAGLLFVGQLVVALAGKGKVNVLRPELVVIHLGNAVFKALEREVVGTQNHILRRHRDRAAVLRTQQVVGREHQDTGLGLRLGRQGHVNSHLVAVEVRVECRAVQRVELEGAALDQHRLERLNTETVERRRAVEHDGVILDDDVERVPDLGAALIDHLLGGLDVVGGAVLDELLHNEGAEQLECHFLRHTALVDLQLRADADNATAGVVDTLAEQVLTEAALLTLEHVGKGLECAVVRTGDSAAAAAVVDQRVDRFLQHALLVAHDDVGRVELNEAL